MPRLPDSWLQPCVLPNPSLYKHIHLQSPSGLSVSPCGKAPFPRPAHLRKQRRQQPSCWRQIPCVLRVSLSLAHRARATSGGSCRSSQSVGFLGWAAGQVRVPLQMLLAVPWGGVGGRRAGCSPTIRTCGPVTSYVLSSPLPPAPSACLPASASQKSSSSASSEASETCQSVSECSSPTSVSAPTCCGRREGPGPTRAGAHSLLPAG